MGGMQPESPDFCLESRTAQAKTTQASIASAETEQWRNSTLAQLIRHIVTKHHGYLREEFPAIEQLLVAAGQNSGGQHADGTRALMKIFQQFRRGMEEHMKKEEAILFPMIEKFESARAAGQDPPRLPFGSIGHPIAVMEQEHERARRELTQIRTLTSAYTTLAAGEHASILQKFRMLEADMEVHSGLEDEVLFPRAVGLERI